jgi:hypothetical protein
MPWYIRLSWLPPGPQYDVCGAPMTVRFPIMPGLEWERDRDRDPDRDRERGRGRVRREGERDPRRYRERRVRRVGDRDMRDPIQNEDERERWSPDIGQLMESCIGIDGDKCIHQNVGVGPV